MKPQIIVVLTIVGCFLGATAQNPTCGDAVADNFTQPYYFVTGRPTDWFKLNKAVMNKTQLHVKKSNVVSSMVPWGGCSAISLRVAGGVNYQVGVLPRWRLMISLNAKQLNICLYMA